MHFKNKDSRKIVVDGEKWSKIGEDGSKEYCFTQFFILHLSSPIQFHCFHFLICKSLDYTKKIMQIFL